MIDVGKSNDLVILLARTLCKVLNDDSIIYIIDKHCIWADDYFPKYWEVRR